MTIDNTNSSYPIRIGKTTFIVCVKQAETAKKPLETALFDLCKREVLDGLSAPQKLGLENHAKTS